MVHSTLIAVHKGVASLFGWDSNQVLRLEDDKPVTTRLSIFFFLKKPGGKTLDLGMATLAIFSLDPDFFIIIQLVSY
jgi:hypothetical protein